MTVNIENWREYMDGAEDAETIIFEVARLPIFDYLIHEVCATQALYDLVRDVWDIAYSYGRHDALVEEGLTLADMEESGE